MISCTYCLASVIVPEELRQDSEAVQWTTLLYDGFTSNDNNWLVENRTSEYFIMNQMIADGRYRWEAEVKRDSSISTSWLGSYHVSDFHLIVNCKHIIGTRANSAWGVIFRIQDNHNFYWFRMTDSQFFAISMEKESRWSDIVDWARTDTIKQNGVNQLEVIARGTHFIFLINGQIVSEADDVHFSQGLVGIAVEGYRAGEKLIFDFLDFTLRAPREV